MLRAGNGYRVIVVCDGVSTTANPDQASAAAAAALADVVEAGLTGREPTADEVLELLAQGVSSAQQAVLAVPADEPGGHVQAPSTTLAAVVIRAGDILAANIGDSRAYWISAGESLQLGRDDSLAEEAIAAGASPSDAYATREAHTITHWLGADAPRLAPHTRSVAAGGEGTVLVCSDGLWNYFKSPGALRDLLLEGPEAETPLAAARRLVEAAIAAGGADNITVAIGPVAAGGPAQPAEPSPEPPAEPAPEPTQPPELPIEAEE